MSTEQMNTELVDTVAGVVRLLRRAAELARVQADAAGPRSPRQLLALRIDLAADEATNLLPRRARLDGPTRPGEPSRAARIRRRVVAPDLRCGRTVPAAGLEGGSRRARVGSEHRCRRLTAARLGSY